MFGSNSRTATTEPTSNGNGNGNGHGGHHSTASAPNRLSSDVSIRGDVTFASELVIDGKVEGSIMSEGKLTIGANGKVFGDIQAGSITIQGLVKGDILASDRCALHAGANLQGDIESPRLAMDESASFNGSATIKAASRS